MAKHQSDVLRGVPFVAVPYDLLVDERLSAQAVRVWAAIASHLMCRCSVPTVQRVIADLVQAGWLDRKQGRKRDGTSALTGTPCATDEPSRVMHGRPSPVMHHRPSGAMGRK